MGTRITKITTVFFPMIVKVFTFQSKRLMRCNKWFTKAKAMLKIAKAKKNSKSIVKYTKKVHVFVHRIADAHKKIKIAKAQKKVAKRIVVKAKKCKSKKALKRLLVHV